MFLAENFTLNIGNIWAVYAEGKSLLNRWLRSQKSQNSKTYFKRLAAFSARFLKSSWPFSDVALKARWGLSKVCFFHWSSFLKMSFSLNVFKIKYTYKVWPGSELWLWQLKKKKWQATTLYSRQICCRFIDIFSFI